MRKVWDYGRNHFSFSRHYKKYFRSLFLSLTRINHGIAFNQQTGDYLIEVEE